MLDPAHHLQGYDHEIAPHRPLTAEHNLEGIPSVCATLYGGESHPAPGGSSTREVHPATIETQLNQVGDGRPVVKVYLWHYTGAGKRTFEKRLKLTVQHARELISALGYVCDIADGARMPEPHGD